VDGSSVPFVGTGRCVYVGDNTDASDVDGSGDDGRCCLETASLRVRWTKASGLYTGEMVGLIRARSLSSLAI